MSQENIDAILMAVEALNRHDAEAFVAAVSPDVAWETNPEMVGLGGIYHGRAGVREFFKHLFGLETWESIQVEVEEITEASDTACWSGCSQRPAAGAAVCRQNSISGRCSGSRRA
jgi:ketosteroid isomerase-like protein